MTGLLLSVNMPYVYIGIIVPITIIIPAIPAIIKYSYLPSNFQVIAWYLLLSGSANIINNLLGFKGINNMPVAHAYTALELSVLCIFYKRTLVQSRLNRHIYDIIFIFIVLCI